MNYNSYTNKKIITKINKNNPSSINSLRSIINQTKIPLSHYINNNQSKQSIQKRNINVFNNNKQIKGTYFQKLKGRLSQNNNKDNIFMKTQQNIRNNHTPMKSQQKNRQNYEDCIYDQNQYDQKNNSQLVSKTINMSYSKQKSKSKIKLHQKSINQTRLSYQPKKIKTQNQTINPLRLLDNQNKKAQNYYYPPKPQSYLVNLDKNNKKNYIIDIKQQFDKKLNRIMNHNNNNNNKLKHFQQIQPYIIIKKQQNYNNYQSIQQQQKQKTSMIQHIHSYRRLNFMKQQQRRTQIIKYSKKFNKISINKHYQQLINQLQNSTIEINQILGTGAYAYVKLGTVKINMNKLKNIPLSQQLFQNKNKFKLAIKIYQKYKLIQTARKRRVSKQIQILSKINHPNIIKLFGVYEDKRQIHMLFECLQNAITLQQYFKHKSFHFDNHQEILFILKQISKGLNYLHQIGVAHRDLKPDNILIAFNTNNKNRFIVKIIDFGFAINSLQSKLQCGTPNFMSPQLFDINKTNQSLSYYTLPIDIWSFGVMFYYLFQGKYPFKGYNQKDLIRNIHQHNICFQKTNQGYKNIILSLLSYNPKNRINSQQLLEWFQNLNSI